MKYVSYNLDSKINSSLFSISKNKTINEEQILALQDLFLESGFHEITVSTLQQGRELIYTLLNALRCYSSIGCITQQKLPLKNNVFDIFEYLEFYGFCSDSHQLDLFFTQECEFDFIWIEYTKTQPWNIDFENALRNAKIDHNIPIICLISDHF